MAASLATLSSSNAQRPTTLISTLTAAMGNRSKKHAWKKRVLDIRNDVIILPDEVQENDIVILYVPIRHVSYHHRLLSLPELWDHQVSGKAL
jgi:7,8-dihydro-6-hydroxymethylpterin-pyrophosphokinase